MQQQSKLLEGNLVTDQIPEVEDFLHYLGELIAQEYIQWMKLASQNIEHTNKSEK